MKEDFSNPEFYKKTFENCLNDNNNEKKYIDNLTIISAYAQTMNSRIGGMFNDNFRKEIKNFVEYSYTEDTNLEKNRDFLERVVEEIKSLILGNN